MNGIDSASDGEDALRAGVTPASSDAYYKAKLRAGFIDLRNSYNEKIRPRTNTFPNRQLGGPPPVPRELGRVAERPPLPSDMAPPSKSLVGRRELYRSNSSLELDRLDNGTEARDAGALHREYGSASSLDVVTTNGESFFAMLQDYRNENLDQRAPAPPKIQEVLRGKVDLPPKPPTSLSPNGKVPNGALSGEDIPEGSHSPKLKTKSQKSKEKKQRNKSVVGDSSSGGGIFKKLRGGKPDSESNNTKAAEGNVELDPKVEERQKRKALVHYDCQSVGISLADVIKRKNSLNRRRNTKTGASAASGARTDCSHQAMSEDDNGDGKTNDLVLSCPYFRNEVGGEEERMISLNRMTAQKRVQNLLGIVPCGENSALMRRPACNGVAILDNSPSPTGIMPPALLAYKGLVVEHVDHGAFYYRHFFHNYEHQNFFGMDDNIGPVAVSVKREKLSDGDSVGVRPDPAAGALYQYRIIVRTSELQTLRGVVLEESIPCSSRLSSTRGLPPKDVLEFVVPELLISCLKAATPGNRTEEQLMMLDEQGLTQHYKIGIMYCRPGQATEEEMYNNEHAGGIFDQFLDCIGKRVRLKGFDKYRGGLDNKTDSTGTESLFATFHNYEVMFHVSTLLPFTPNNRQQLLRKRHIGNDIVTIVFQEPGALPFTPRSVRSHFQHVFIIVRAHCCEGDKIRYSLAVTRSKDVPPFGPPITDGPMFDPSPEFTEFLLTKAINAENAAHKSEKFTVMATRTRQEYIKDLATNFVTTSNLDSGSKLSKFSLGSGRKKEKPKSSQIPDIWARGCLVWAVEVEDFGGSLTVPCFLGIAADTFVIIEDDPHHVVFTMPCKSVIAWTAQADSLRLYYDHGECLALRVASGDQEEVQEIVDRLRVVSKGCQTAEMTLRRNGLGQLGFHLHYDAIVADVEPHGFAWQAGLRQGSRLVEICKVATATLTHDQMIDLLRTSVTVKVIVVKPHEDGSPRRGCEDLGSSHSSLSSPHTPSSDRLLLEEESTTATLRNIAMTTKHTTHAEPQGMTMTSSHSHRNPPPIFTNTQTDRRTDHTDRRKEQHPEPQHDKQPSRDSTGSRSSGHGSMEGSSHPEGRGGRIDTALGDGFASGDERHSRHNYSDQSEDRRGDWSSRGTNYAPYGRDQTGYSPPSPHHHQGDGWFDHGATSDGELRTSSYQGNAAYLSRTANLPQTSKPTSAFTSSAHGTAEPQSYGGGDPGKWDGLGASDPTSSSSNTLRPLPHSRSHGQETTNQRGAEREQYAADDRDIWSRNALPKSPPLRRAQLSALGSQQRRSYLEPSPSSSNNSSPKNQRRGQQGSSSESLANRLRPGVSTSTKITTSPGSSNGTNKPPKSSTFQEELMRLIDPDVSLAELENSINKPSKLKLPSRPPRLHRTLSDESLCSTQPNRIQQTYGQEVFSADVLFGASKLSSSRENLDRGHRGPGTELLDKGLERTQDSRNLAASSPLLPLPDAAMGLDWNNLLDAANKAFKDDNGRPTDRARLLSLHFSKSADPAVNRHPSAEQIYQNVPARPPPIERSSQDRHTLKLQYEAQDKINERLAYLREHRQLHGSQERLNYSQPDRLAQYDAARYGSMERLHYNLQERLGHVRDRPDYGSQERLHQSSSDYEHRRDYESQERLNDRYPERLKERRDHTSRERLNYAGRDGYDQQGSGLAPMAPLRQGSLDRSSRGSVHSDGAAGEPQAHGGSGPGSSAGSSPNQRWQELETQLSRLQHQLGEERERRLTLEARVQQLTLDNVRLQEESTTAAQQLRRFTEWFFNTIDRQ